MLDPSNPSKTHLSARCQWHEISGRFTLREIVHPPGLRLGWHSHEWGAFTLTLRGASTEAFGATRFERTQHTVLVRPAGVRHADLVSPSGAKCFLIEFEQSLFDTLPEFRRALQQPTFHRIGAMSHLAQRAYREWQYDDSASQLSIQALVIEMAAHLIRQRGSAQRFREPYWLRKVKQRLDDDYENCPNLLQLSDIANVHPTHLARQFRRCYRKSVGEYLRQRRVDAAIKLLTESDLSLAEIANATGFAHQAHLTFVFKRFMGATPGEYRRLFRVRCH